MTTATLNREEILSLPAGRELDALVATRVMGIGWQGGNPIPGDDGRWPWPAPYSTDIAAAWEVVEKLRKDGLVVKLTLGTLAVRVDLGRTYRADLVEHTTSQDSVAAAICRAALLAVVGEGKT